MNTVNRFGQPIGKIVVDWVTPREPHFNLLEGKLCTIESIDLSRHVDDLFASLSFNNVGESWTYFTYGPFTTAQQFADWLTIKCAEKDLRIYVIMNKNKKPLGMASYLRINPTDGSIEVGHIHYSKLLQKSSLATEAMYLLMKHAFEDLGYRRYEWKCDSLNNASRNAALRLGFTFEGIFTTIPCGEGPQS